MRDLTLKNSLLRKILLLCFMTQLYSQQAIAETKLIADDAAELDRFGTAVDIDGQYAVIGSKLDNNYDGSVYVFSQGYNLKWEQSQYLVPSENTESFGKNLNVSGDHFVVGTNDDNAFVFERVYDNGWIWQEEQVLYVPGNLTLPVIHNDTIVLGNPAGDNSVDNAYIYLKLDEWMPMQTINGNIPNNSQFASGIAIDEDYTIIIEPYDNTLHIYDTWNWGSSTEVSIPWPNYDLDTNNISRYGNLILATYNNDKGSVYIVEKQNGNWTYEKTLLNPDNNYGEARFGFDHAIINENLIAISEPNRVIPNGPIAPKGSVYFYKRTNEQNWEKIKTVNANDGHNFDNYGHSIDFDSDDCKLLVGAPHHGAGNYYYAGAAYEYDIVNVLGHKKMGSTTTNDDNFGIATGVTTDGNNNFLISGAYLNDDNGENQGAAYIFRQQENGDWIEIATLYGDGNNSEKESFGYAVDIDGDYAVVGAPGNDNDAFNSGAAYVFKSNDNGEWELDAVLKADDAYMHDVFGSSVAIDNNRIIVGAFLDDDKGSSSGSAYIFKRELNSEWVQEEKIVADDGYRADWFGRAVDIVGKRVIIGAYQDDDKGDASGSAYIYKIINNIWKLEQKLTAPDLGAVDFFGFDVSIKNNFAAVGAPRQDHMENGSSTGAIYMFDYANGQWNYEHKLVAPDAQSNDLFGQSVDLSVNDNYVQVVGGTAFADKDVAINDNPDKEIKAAGAAYLFTKHEGLWTLTRKHEAENPYAADFFGTSVAMDSNLVVVGAPTSFDHEKQTRTGAIYVFDENICQ